MIRALFLALALAACSEPTPAAPEVVECPPVDSLAPIMPHPPAPGVRGPVVPCRGIQ